MSRDHEGYVDLLLGQLADLEQRSIWEDIKGVGRDQLASDALTQAGALTRAVAGWAMDYKIGLAKADLAPLPLASVTMTNKPDYQSQRSKVDDRAHEVAGHGFSPEDLANPILARRMLVNVLLSNPAGFPDGLNSMLVEALRALDEGETPPLLKAKESRDKVRFQERNLQLKALAHVEYRRALGATKEDAETAVTSAYCVCRETLRSWRKRLSESRGPLVVELAVSRGREAAAWDKDEHKRYGASAQRFGEAAYGDEALKADAAEYRRFGRRQRADKE